MNKVKVKLKIDDYTLARLSEFEDIGKAVSDIITKSFLKSQNGQFDSKDRRGILDRTYAYHKRVQPNIQYTRQTFVDKYLTDQKFNDMFNDYVASGYEKKLMPSFKKAINLYDVELMTYEELMLLGRNATPVVYSQYGQPPIHYKSINEASKGSGFPTGRIIRCMKLGPKERKGSDKWFYNEKDYKKYMKKSKELFDESMS